MGKLANCQEGVFAVYVSPSGYAFLDMRLYVHEDWFDEAHRERWKKCGIPADLPFRTKPELALDRVRELVTRGRVPFEWVTFDEHLRDISKAREGAVQGYSFTRQLIHAYVCSGRGG